MVIIAFLFSIIAYIPWQVQDFLFSFKFIDNKLDVISFIGMPTLFSCTLLCVFALYLNPEDLRRTIAEMCVFMLLPIIIAWSIQYYVPFGGWLRLFYLVPLALCGWQITLLIEAIKGARKKVLSMSYSV